MGYAGDRSQGLLAQLVLVANDPHDRSVSASAKMMLETHFLDASQNVINLIVGGEVLQDQDHGELSSVRGARRMVWSPGKIGQAA